MRRWKRILFHRDLFVVGRDVVSRVHWYHLLWTIPVLIALVHYTRPSVVVDPDMSQYQTWAINLYSGDGYTYSTGVPVVKRAPVFAGTLALGYHLFGASVGTTYLVLILYGLAVVALVYLIGHYILNKWVGLLGALFVASSPAIRKTLLSGIDGASAAVLLAILLAVAYAVEQPSTSAGLLTGLAFGTGYLLKETAILFVPLVLLTVRRHYGDWRRLGKFVGATVVGFLLLYTPWLLYSLTLPEGVYWAASGGSKSRLVLSVLMGDEPFPVGPIITFVSGAIEYFLETRAYYTLGPVFGFGWLYLSVYTLKIRDKSMTLVAAPLLFSPIVVFTLEANWRQGQMLVVDVLSMLAVAALVVSGLRYAFQRVDVDSSDHRRAVTVVAGLLVICSCLVIAGALVETADDTRKVVASSTVTQSLAGGDDVFTYSGKFGTPGVKPAARWIDRTESGRTNVMITQPGLRDEIHFESRGTVDPVGVPRVRTEYLSTGENRAFIAGTTANVSADDVESETPMWVRENRIGTGAGHKFLIYTQEDLLATIERKNVDYVVTGQSPTLFRSYFESHPGFTLENTYGDGTVAVFSVDNGSFEPIAFDPRINRATSDYLQSLDRNSEEYEWVNDVVFARSLGFTEQQFTAVKRGENNASFVWTS